MTSDSHFTALSKELTVSSADGSPVKLPLATRAIGGFLLLIGILDVFDLVRSVAFGNHSGAGAGFLLALLGWGLLKRRNWAREWTAFFCVLWAVVGCLGFVLAWIGDAASFNISFVPTEIGDFARQCLFAGIMLTLAIATYAARRHLTSDSVTRHFQNHAPKDPFIVWNPRRWRFRISTLLFVTMIVAFASMRLAQEPAMRHLGVLLEAVNTPSYLEGLPPLPLESGSEMWSLPRDDGQIGMLEFGYHTPPIGLGTPMLDFAVFQRSEGSAGSGLRFSSGSFQIGRYELDLEGESIQFPGEVQLVEIRDGQVEKSDMYISFAEFWSYLHSKGRENSLSALEEHVNRLRRNLAEPKE